MKTGQLRVSLWTSRRIKQNIIAIIRIINKTTVASEKALNEAPEEFINSSSPSATLGTALNE